MYTCPKCIANIIHHPFKEMNSYHNVNYNIVHLSSCRTQADCIMESLSTLPEETYIWTIGLRFYKRMGVFSLHIVDTHLKQSWTVLH